MNSIKFVEEAKKIANSKTVYATGTFGQRCTPTFIDAKATQYPKQYPTNKINKLKSLGYEYRMYDCCGLIKSILWSTESGQIVYTANGVPDLSDQGLWDVCRNKSTDFMKIEPGCMVHIKGHVGIYIGNNLVVEATSAFEGKVIITTMDLKDKTHHYRAWNEYGYLPYIEYIKHDCLFGVQVDTDYLEVHRNYDILKVYRDRPALEIVETRENFGRLKEGGWIDLTKCRRITLWM